MPLVDLYAWRLLLRHVIKTICRTRSSDMPYSLPTDERVLPDKTDAVIALFLMAKSVGVNLHITISSGEYISSYNVRGR